MLSEKLVFPTTYSPLLKTENETISIFVIESQQEDTSSSEVNLDATTIGLAEFGWTPIGRLDFIML